MTKKEFKLPEKWCCRPQDNKELNELYNYLKDLYSDWEGESIDNYYYYYPPFRVEKRRKYFAYQSIIEGYKEITFNQFKEYVLNKTNNNMTENKEIIGYKLVKPDYIKAACIISGNENLNYCGAGFCFTPNSPSYDKLQKAGVLDLWFEPVYKPKYELPEINGYKGRLQDDCIIYGCANFRDIFFTKLLELNNSDKSKRKIKSITLDSGVVITIEQIK